VPELPEVETVRRLLEASVLGRTVRSVRLSGLALREPISRGLPRRLVGRRFLAAGRRGKYLLLGLDQGLTLLSHLGMSGRWLFHRRAPRAVEAHVHVRIRFTDGTQLWFQDPRRFGLVSLIDTRRLPADRRLAGLGPDPVSHPPTAATLRALASGTRVSLKAFLLDQRRMAGIGNIYASEILHRARVDPRVPAGAVAAGSWGAVARATTRVLAEAIERCGTTFDSYRTPWNEAGGFGDQLRVYDRAGEPCRTCRTPIRRIVQGSRSTFYCPRCQAAGPALRRRRPRRRGASGLAGRASRRAGASA
jgi:formamidopyrimidine-DNA glycosylase